MYPVLWLPSGCCVVSPTLKNEFEAVRLWSDWKLQVPVSRVVLWPVRWEAIDTAKQTHGGPTPPFSNQSQSWSTQTTPTVFSRELVRPHPIQDYGKEDNNHDRASELMF
eukprot:TRINITY_DN12069_c0_g1_i2.p1 TRINITY_DN12069_c0_g1~~TRINITY_DN12069_c0_g1_i2.p1  ORF type:complete len:109 (-),score=4.19 TRINITY_DN12069_c0_g1_i2:91-417(-)